MPDQSFPYPVEMVVSTLAELLRIQGRNALLVEVLESANARIEEAGYDGWDGGTYFYTLFLDIPLKLYAKTETLVEGMQKTISSKLGNILKDTGNQILSNVVISPILQQVVPVVARQKVAEADAEHLWDPGFFRLFLCHVADHKIAVSNLKQPLQVFGVSGFVAHEDIEPNLEWQREIELALGSMQALAALLTPEFKQSRWTDQEVGVALGRGLLVIPVKLGLDPYGFIGKHQALSGALNAPDRLASAIVDVLIKQKSTSPLMREALVTALEKAPSFAASKAITSRLEMLVGFTTEQLIRMEAASKDKKQVRESFGVPERIQKIINRHKSESETDVPF